MGQKEAGEVIWECSGCRPDPLTSQDLGDICDGAGAEIEAPAFFICHRLTLLGCVFASLRLWQVIGGWRRTGTLSEQALEDARFLKETEVARDLHPDQGMIGHCRRDATESDQRILRRGLLVAKERIEVPSIQP